MTRARRVWLIAAAVVLAVAIAAAILTRFPSGSRAAAPKGPTAITVTTAPVVAKSVPVKLTAIGNVGSDQAIPALVRAIGVRSFFRRKKARAIKERGVGALTRIGSAKAISALENAGKTGDRLLKTLIRNRTKT